MEQFASALDCIIDQCHLSPEAKSLDVFGYSRGKREACPQATSVCKVKTAEERLVHEICQCHHFLWSCLQG